MTTQLSDERLDQLLRSVLTDLAEDTAAVAAPAADVASRIQQGRAGHPPALRLILVAAAALLAIAAVAVGARLLTPPVGPDMLLMRGGDLFHSAGDPVSPPLLASGSATDGRRGYVFALVSPTREHVAAVRDAGTTLLEPVVEILRLNDGAAGRIELAPGGPPGLAWAPDGRSLAVAAYPVDQPKSQSGDIASTLELGIHRLDGSLDRRLELPESARTSFIRLSDPYPGSLPLRLSWSPDGLWIALTTGDGPLLIPPDGAAAQRLELPVSVGTVSHLAWHPDGGRVAFTADCPSPPQDGCRSRLWSTDVSGGSPTLIAGPEVFEVDEALASLAWSPDGNRLVVWSTLPDPNPASSAVLAIRTRLWVIDLERANAASVVVDASAEALDGGALATGELVAWPFAWTPDGEQILYLSHRPENRTELRAVPTTGGSSVLLAEDVGNFAVTGR